MTANTKVEENGGHNSQHSNTHPPLITHTTLLLSAHTTTLPHPQHKKKEDRTIRKGSRTMQSAIPNLKTGHHSTHTPRHSTRPPYEQDRGTSIATEGTPTFERESVTLPPFTRHTTHHPQHTPHQPQHSHPLRREGGEADRGYPTTRRPRTDTHPHTAPDTTGNSARHKPRYSTACTEVECGPGRALDLAGQRHPPPPFNTTHRDG